MGLKFSGKAKQNKQRTKIEADEPVNRRVERLKSDLEVVDITAEDAADWGGGSDNGEYKLKDGENVFVILPPLKKFGIRTPWIDDRNHFLGRDITNLIGFDLPDDIPMVHGCGIVHGDGTCEWDNQARKLKRSRSRRDQDFGKALYAAKKYISNIVDLRVSKDDRFVQWCRYGEKVREVLHSAINDGEIFCSPSGLIPVRVIRTGTGINTRYTTKVLVNKPRVELLGEWIEKMHDLTSFSQPVASPEEVRNWISVLLGDERSEDDDGSFDDIDYD